MLSATKKRCEERSLTAGGIESGETNFLMLPQLHFGCARIALKLWVSLIRAVRAIRCAWRQALPIEVPNCPNLPPVIATGALLHEGSILPKDVDIFSDKLVP